MIRNLNLFLVIGAGVLSQALAMFFLAGCAPQSQPEVATTSALRRGVVNADDYKTLQEAVDALGSAGGVVQLSSKIYNLSRPLRIDAKISLVGTMDAKISRPATRIQPGHDFVGKALITTCPKPAVVNADLNSDICLRDLVINGRRSLKDLTTGILATNVDVLRIERCRIAYFDIGVKVALKTDMPRPYTSPIVPGGLYMNNNIFHAYDTCISLEYCTQNRIYANWFVGGFNVAVKLKNCNKTWIVANEINTFNRAAVLLEDDGKGNCLNNVVISLNLCQTKTPNTRYIEFINPDDMINLMISDNLFHGVATIDMSAIKRASGMLFHNNGNVRQRSENSGEIKIPTGRQRVKVPHKLLGIPKSIQLTPLQKMPEYWIENRTKNSFDIVLVSPASKSISLLWRAAVQ